MLEENIVPKDIKNCSFDELADIAIELRGKIIDVCAGKGGHLASSLGAVELCLALHYVLNTPEDLIVFDVGHQSYAHKLLTGRSKEFHKIREYKGLSGFPNIQESEYDAFTVGHASNAVSLALGAVAANRLLKKQSKVVAVIGDGSMSGGECFEGLNNAGHLKEDITVIFNHNEMSISPAVGAFSNYFNEVQTSPVYNRARKAVDKTLEKIPTLNRLLRPRIKKVEEIIKGVFVPGLFFEELGFRYFGPLDGHNLEQLVGGLQKIINLSGPKLVHVVTKKGKGFTPAEKDAESFHSAGKFCKDKGTFHKKKNVSYTDVFGEKMLDLAEKDSSISALTAAMESGTGLSCFRQKFTERFFDVGIAEQHLVSFAGGLCRQGIKPFAAVYSTFLQRGYDQLMQDIALQGFAPVFCLDRAGLVGEDGPTHHGVFDISYLRTVPHFVIMAPGYKKDLEMMLEFAAGLDKPSAIRYPKGRAYELEIESSMIKLGKSEIIRKGKDVAIVALGAMLEQVFAAEEKLKEQKIEATIVNARFAKPLDEELLLKLAEEHKHIHILEEGSLNGGFCEAVTAFYHSKGTLSNLDLHTYGIKDEFVTLGRRDILLKLCGLDSDHIVDRVVASLKQKNKTKG